MTKGIRFQKLLCKDKNLIYLITTNQKKNKKQSNSFKKNVILMGFEEN